MSDKWVLSELARTAAEVTANLDKYELGLAAEKVENFIWDIYCDWYIEICKSRLNGEDAQQADTARKVLVWVLDKALYAVHHRGDLPGIARQRRDHHDPGMAGRRQDDRLAAGMCRL